jgi:hypothetical protein
MMTAFGKTKVLGFAGALGVLAFGSINSSYAALTTTTTNSLLSHSLSGIIPPSLPAFVEGVNVQYMNGSGGTKVLTATYQGYLNLSSLVYTNKVFNIKNTSYSLTANFNNSNVFQNGTVNIQGSIAGLGINTKQTLMTADLTQFATGYRGHVLGFNTANILCNPLINAYSQCTTAESVFIGLFKGFNFKTDFKSNGYALTSVPIPTAAWLFGSGLLGLAGIARRKKMASSKGVT